jgi:hypothetical protein
MVTHPRFELGAPKVSREMKSAIKGKFAQDLDWKLNRSKGSDGGTKIMNRRIDSRSTAGSSHTQTHDNAFKRKLLASTLNLPWLQAAVSKFKSGVVPSKICLRVEYQKGRGLHHLSNGYLLAFRHSTVQVLWLFADWQVAENYNSGQIAAMKEKYILGLFMWDSSPELNTKMLEKLSQLSIGYLYILIGPTV